MSKLVDLIDKIAAGPERRMGFGQSQEQSDRQLPILIAITNGDTPSKSLLESDVIASIIPNLTALKKQLSGKRNLPWGIWASDDMEKIIGKVCESKGKKPDFIAFSAEIQSLEIMQDPDITKILRIPLSISPDSLVGMSSIPIDAVTVQLEQGQGVSLETVGRLGTIRSIIDKPLLLELSEPTSAPLLALIKDLGIEGLAIHTSADNPTSVSGIREMLDSIPKKDKRSEKNRPRASIGSAFSFSVSADEHEELE